MVEIFLFFLVRNSASGREEGTYLFFDTGCLKEYPLLTGNRNKTIRFHNSMSGQLNSSIFNLDAKTLHLKFVHQTPEIQACKVKIYSALNPDVLKRA